MTTEDLLKKAVAAFNALLPEQKAEMLEEQRQSWVRSIAYTGKRSDMIRQSLQRKGLLATGKCGESSKMSDDLSDRLVTVAGEYLEGHTWKPIPSDITDFALRGVKTRALCDRSQAEALIREAQRAADELLAEERAQTDAYGIALMMIREGCENPYLVARNALERFSKWR